MKSCYTSVSLCTGCSYLLVTAGAQIKAEKLWRMRKNEGANWGVYHLLLLLLVCKRSTPYLSSNHIRCDKKQWSLKMNRGAGSVLRIMERILGVGKRRERIMNFQQIAEKHMKKSLWRLLSVSLCLFHSFIFSPPSLFFLIYISWSSTFVDFTILYIYLIFSSVHCANLWLCKLKHYHCSAALFIRASLFIFLSSQYV